MKENGNNLLDIIGTKVLTKSDYNYDKEGFDVYIILLAKPN